VIVPAWFDDFADAVAAGEATYRSCVACGHATLPPRERCPDCGAGALESEPLDGRGEISSYTEISVTIPKFHGETPYTVALVELADDVALTGQLRDATADDVAVGDPVVLGVEDRDEGPALFTFRPVEG
jgi:hypothetical protein